MSLLSTVRSEPEPSYGFFLEDLISPHDPDRFLAEQWERQHLFVEREDPGYYSRLFTLEDVDRVLHVARSYPEKVLSVAPPQGSGKERRQIRVAEISRDELYSSFGEGCTLRLGNVDRFWPPLALFKAALSERLSAEVSINFYLSPKSAQGYVAHYDSRDSFILQLYGSKRWHLGDPIYELPGVGLEHVSDRVPSHAIANDSPRLSQSVVLRSGDLLYLPRGFYHKPVTEDETSLHLTVGINPVHWGAFLARSLEFVTFDHLDLRRSLPPGFAIDPEARRGMAETFTELVRTFTREAPFQETLDSLLRDRRRSEAYPGDGHFASLDRVESVTEETMLERRLGLTCTVDEQDDKVVIRFGSNFVSGPQAVAPVFEFIRDNRRRFRVADLPGPLSDRSKAVLARRLIREGLLRQAD